MTAAPDVVSRNITPDVEFIVLACDGIWDVMSSQEVVDFIRDRLASNIEPEMVAYCRLSRTHLCVLDMRGAVDALSCARCTNGRTRLR